MKDIYFKKPIPINDIFYHCNQDFVITEAMFFDGSNEIIAEINTKREVTKLSPWDESKDVVSMKVKESLKRHVKAELIEQLDFFRKMNIKVVK